MMYTCSLITDPKRANLEPELVASLRNAWGGGEAVWLQPDVAAEFSVGAVPEGVWETWSTLQEMSVDLVVQPTTNRRKRLLLADMDSTMIQQECIDELAAEVGVGAQVADITARAMNGEIDFEGALNERVGLLKGSSEAILQKVLDNRISFTAGGKTLVATMRAHGGYAALVSGGFTAFTGPVAAHLGFDEHRSNQFDIVDGTLTGAVIPPIFGREAKVDALNDLSVRLGLTDEQVLAVGDGANDLGMLKRAGMGVALHAKPTVQQQVDIRINHGDLTALLFVQGYSADEFA